MTDSFLLAGLVMNERNSNGWVAYFNPTASDSSERFKTLMGPELSAPLESGLDQKPELPTRAELTYDIFSDGYSGGIGGQFGQTFNPQTG